MTDDHVKKMQEDAICAWKDSRHAVEVIRTERGAHFPLEDVPASKKTLNMVVFSNQIENFWLSL